MAEGGFENKITSWILISLFGMLILSAVVLVASTYSKDTSGVVGGSLSLTKFNESVSSVETNAKNLKASFDQGSIWSALAGVVVEGIFGISKTMVTMILAPFDIVSDILSDNLGIPSYVTSVILGIFIIGLIFSIWRLLKIGD